MLHIGVMLLRIADIYTQCVNVINVGWNGRNGRGGKEALMNRNNARGALEKAKEYIEDAARFARGHSIPYVGYAWIAIALIECLMDDEESDQDSAKQRRTRK